MVERIYTLNGVAKILDSTVNSIRAKINVLNWKKEPLVWRGFRFIPMPNKGHIAIEEDEELEIID